MILITGGSGSGKSAYAEHVAVEKHKNGEGLYYLATMRVYDEEGRKKIARHRQQRRGKGFVTIEKPTNILEAAFEIEETSCNKNSVVLLECLSNLVANEMFREQLQTAEQVSQKVIEEICRLNKSVKELVIVTNNVFEDGVCYDEATTAYLKALGSINVALAGMADCVWEVVVGIPLLLKQMPEKDS